MTTTTTLSRTLGDNGGYESPYFEEYDSSGDSYGLAWRYLGVFMDESDSYARKVLWAAYYDPNYSGNQIGEYQYYDFSTGSWDSSTCVSGSRCAPMDCHFDTGSSTFELIGVYKESLTFGGDTFFEQLFKHHGYCLWGEDSSDYEFMQSMREELSGSCQKISYNVYIGAKPLSGGDLTYAVYKDSYCKKETYSSSSSSTATTKVDKYLTNSVSGSWNRAFKLWNSNMEAYKVCQPCRAYSRTSNYADSWRDRGLVEYNDGEGDEEINGFNCYDDAGYRNCNQCYKFDTHTDMEEADKSDLKAASKQGTIVSITVNDVTYGGDQSYHTYQSSMGVVVVAVVVVAALLARYRCTRRVIVANDDDTVQPTNKLDQPLQ